MNLLNILLILLALSLFILGFMGLIYPAIPGLPIMFIAVWIIAYVGKYEIIGIWSLIIVAIITIFGMIMDFIASFLGAKFSGASKYALWGAFIGGIIGMFFSLIGIIIAPIIGAAIGEYIAKKDLFSAGKVSIGTFVGFIVGVISKLATALIITLLLVTNHILYFIKYFN